MRKQQKSVNFTMEEKEAIEEAAKGMGLTYAGFIRMASIKTAKEMSRFRED